MDHLEERAELYALGMLEADEAARVDAHVSECRACERRVGAAEAAVAALVDATITPADTPAAVRAAIPTELPARTESGRGEATRAARRMRFVPPVWSGAAAAAVFAGATVFLGVQNAALQGHVAADGSLFESLVTSHFSHAPFNAPDGTPISAKVVYERHGDWYEIFALGIDPGTRVAVVRGGAATELSQRFSRSGATLALRLHGLGRIDEFRLLDASGRAFAGVHPAYARDGS